MKDKKIENPSQKTKPEIQNAILPPTIPDLSDFQTIEKTFFEQNIFPLLTILNNLSNTSSNLASSVDILSKTYTKHPDRSELKETIHLIYDINEECDDVYRVLKKRINKLLKIDNLEANSP